jgi:hypothetical protein
MKKIGRVRPRLKPRELGVSMIPRYKKNRGKEKNLIRSYWAGMNFRYGSIDKAIRKLPLAKIESFDRDIFKVYVSPDKKKSYLVYRGEGTLGESLHAFKILKGPNKGEYWLENTAERPKITMRGHLLQRINGGEINEI